VSSVVGTHGESLLRIMWQRRLIVLLVVLAGVIAAFVYLFQAQPLYVSYARLYVEQKGPKIITEQEGVMTQSKNYLYTQCELMTSTPILAEVVRSPLVNDMKSFAGINSRVAYLKGALKVAVGKKDDIINVSMESAYPEEAAQLVNMVVDAYIAYHTTQKQSTSSEILKILKKEKVKRDEELSEKSQAVLAFIKANGTFSLESTTDNVVTQRLTRLSDALTEAQLELLETKTNYESVNSMINDPARIRMWVESQMANGKYISFSAEQTELHKEIQKLQDQLRALRQEGTFDHPVVQNTWQDIAQTQRRLAELESKFAQAYRNALIQQQIAAVQKETEIKESLGSQQQLALELNTKVAQYAILQSDLDRTEKLYDILVNRIKEIDVTEDAGALNISIVETARPAVAASKPQKARVMTIGLVLGSLLGVLLALLRDWSDPRLRSADEISTILGVPVLGVLPSVVSKRVTLGSLKSRNCALISHLKPRSMDAEAYRTIRTAVYFGTTERNGVSSGAEATHKTLLVTSAEVGDGKTTLASNLAITMAQVGRKVIIVDGDFRKPDLHAIFSPGSVEHPYNPQREITAALNNKISLSQAIYPTIVAGLDILPCSLADNKSGSRDGMQMGPAELLSGEAFAGVIKELSAQYEHVIIDSPPVTCVADARILAAMCDMTLLVLRAGKSTGHMTEQSRDGLLSVGANLIGAVVNDVPNSNSRYGYYSGYGYYRRKDGNAPTSVAGSDNGQIVYADTVKAGDNRIEQVNSGAVEQLNRGTGEREDFSLRSK